MPNPKEKKTTPISELLKRLFMRGRTEALTQTQIEVMAASSPAPTQEGHEVAFRAGAAVAFITPIGAYAGTTSNDSLRQRAVQQFHHMDISQNTTIN